MFIVLGNMIASVKTLGILISVVAVSASFFAQAASVAIVNPGFEDISGESQSNEFTFGSLNGWALYDPGNVTSAGDGPDYFIGTLTPFIPDPVGAPGVHTNFPAGAAEGNRVGIAFNRQSTGGGGEYGFRQDLAAELVANTTYTLMVEIGNIASGESMANGFFNLNGFPGYRVDFMVDNITVASDENTLAALIPEGEFRTSTVSYTSGASVSPGQSLSIRLVNLNVPDNSDLTADLEVDFDDVRLDASPVPEPSVFFCFVTGIALFIRRKR